MESIKDSSPLRPPLTFRVGFAGHRPDRLAGADLGEFSKVLEGILAQVRKEVSEIWQSDSSWYSGEGPGFQALSSLAEGSDRIFAGEAIRLGYSLSVPMPFPQDEFEADFLPGKALENNSLERFRNILEQAENSTGLTRFQIIGDRKREAQAYSAAGKIILNQADILIVAWDGISHETEGGTEETLREALNMQIPLIWINTYSENRWMILNETGQIPAANGDGRHVPPIMEDSQGLMQIIKASLALPGFGVSAGNKKDEALTRLADFHNEKLRRRNPAIIWKIFRKILGRRRPAGISSSNQQAESGHDKYLIQGFENKDPGLSRSVESGFSRCDRLSTYNSDFYRSGYILTFLMAALAVGLALFPVLAGWLTHENVTGESITVAAELLTLLFILLLVFQSRSGRWHSRWLDYRLAAEWIRQLRQLAPLGMGIRVREKREHQKSYEHPSSTWMAWYVKALERNLGLPDAKVDKEYLGKYLENLLDLTNDQQAYHADKAKENHQIEKRLHGTGITLVFATIAACTIHLSPIFSQAWHLPAWFSHLLTFLCGFMPALGAALAGINNQGEFRRMAKTSESMQREYLVLSEEISALKEALKVGGDKIDVQIFNKIKDKALHISVMMVEELSDWRITYHNRPMDLPA